MAKRINVRIRKDEDTPSKINSNFVIITLSLTILGVAMLAISNSLGDQCKMTSIDKSSFYETHTTGNLPKWFSITGLLFVFTGIWAVMATGLLPLFCGQKCRKCGGHFWAILMESNCSYMILIYALLINIIMNLIGTFWIYAAKLARTAANSHFPGDENYCHPLMWNTAHMVTYGFWVLLTMGVIGGMARVHHYLRGHILFDKKGKETEEQGLVYSSSSCCLPASADHGA